MAHFLVCTERAGTEGFYLINAQQWLQSWKRTRIIQVRKQEHTDTANYNEAQRNEKEGFHNDWHDSQLDDRKQHPNQEECDKGVQGPMM